jgi:hypothetical protein
MEYNISTHSDIEEISFFKDEKEVLFFPFSAFEIKEIKEKLKDNKIIFEIKLLYLGKYVKEFKQNKEFIESENIIPNSEFKKQIVQIGLINQDNINQNNNAKQLMTKYEKYEENIIRNKNESDIKSIIKNLEIKNNIKKEQKERLDVKQMIKNINKTIIRPNNNDTNKQAIRSNNDTSKKLIAKFNNNDSNKEVIKSNNNISNKMKPINSDNDINQKLNKKKRTLSEMKLMKKRKVIIIL